MEKSKIAWQTPIHIFPYSFTVTLLLGPVRFGWWRGQPRVIALLLRKLSDARSTRVSHCAQVHCLLAGGAIELFMTRVAAAKESGAARQQRSRKIHTRGRPPLKFISGSACKNPPHSLAKGLSLATLCSSLGRFNLDTKAFVQDCN